MTIFGVLQFRKGLTGIKLELGDVVTALWCARGRSWCAGHVSQGRSSSVRTSGRLRCGPNRAFGGSARSGLPCAAPRESCGLPKGRHGHAPVPQPPPAHAGQSSWPRRIVGHPLLVCIVEHALEPQNPACPGRFLSAGRQDRRPPDTSAPPLPCPTTAPADLLCLFPAPPSTPPHRRRPARPSRHRSRTATAAAPGVPWRRRPPAPPHAGATPQGSPSRRKSNLGPNPGELRRPDRRRRAPPAGRDPIALICFFSWLPV
jgi:hypothetical protein